MNEGDKPHGGGASPRELRDFFCDDDYGVVVSPSLWDISQLRGSPGAVDYAQTRREVLGAWTLGSPLTNFPSRVQMSCYSAHLYFIV